MPTGNLPSEGKKIFEKVYADAKTSSTCKDAGDRKEECAARVAWTAVHNAGWKKDAQGNWTKSKSLTEFSMRIDRASYDKSTGERRVRIVASDTDEDNHGDSMSLELYNDFVDRIKKNEPVPEDFQSDFWKGGEPYISISHYDDLNGKGVPGVIDATYIDGNYLKSKGKFNDTPLGRKCFETICSDLYGDTKDREDKVRISIGFLDYMHKHKSSGFVFDRQNAETVYCPECVMEMLKGENQGKIYLKGHLIHEALTRVPVNTRTSMEVDKSMADKILTRKDDASSIVGEDEAENLEELESKIIGKSEVLVTRAEEAPGKEDIGCKDPETGEIDPDCMAKKKGETSMTPEKSEVVKEEKPKKKVPAEKEETKEEKAEFIRSIIKEMKAETVEVVPPPSHILDAYFSEFKNKFDAIVASEATEDEKLQQVQEPFNSLGTGVISVVKSSIKPKEVTPETKGQMDLVEILSKVMNPIAQKLDLVLTQLSTPQVEKPMLPVPQRRSIPPSVVQQAIQQPVIKSETPNLRKIIDNTV